MSDGCTRGVQVAAELSRVAPINLLRPSCRPWAGGAVSLDAVVQRLRELLPPRFEDLEKVTISLNWQFPGESPLRGVKLALKTTTAV